MTTMAIASPQTSGFPFKKAIILAIIIMLAAISLHAIAKHGQDAVTASRCADFPQLRMENPITGRIAFICLTDRGWGVAIFESWGEPVTSFVKEKAKTVEQVIKYLKNAGYR